MKHVRYRFHRNQTFKKMSGSDESDVNRLYLETYLQLSHRTFAPDQLWVTLQADHKKIIKNGLYCTLLIQKLCGVGDDVAVKFFNTSISDIT